jgi:DNA-binding NtrC family response regulator
MVTQFLAEFAVRNALPVRGISAEALRALLAYSWPGNVRELRNVIERAVALCPGTEIQPDDLPDAVRSAAGVPVAPAPRPVLEASQGTLAQSKEEAEAARITAALARHNNNRLRAAEELGISRMTLYKKLHRYGLIMPT